MVNQGNIEQETIEIKSLREELRQAFDTQNTTLKEALKDYSGLYENQREGYVESELLKRANQDLRTQLAKAEALIQDRTEQLKKRSTDSVTGLRRREIMYETLAKEIERILGKEFETLDEQKLLEFLESRDPQELEKVKLSVMMSDVSFLSLVNKISHEAGDQFMSAIGDVARAVGSPKITPPEEEPMDARIVASRYGGDEVTAIIRETRDAAQEIAKEFQLKYRENLSAQRFLQEYGLKPNVDIGLAHFSEGVKAFTMLLKEMIKRGVKAPEEERRKKLMDLMVSIADRRVNFNKGRERLNLLIDKRTKEPEIYEKIISYLRKGAFDATDSEIDQLAQEKAQMTEEEWQKRALEFLYNKVEEMRAKEMEMKAIEEEIIKLIAG